MAANGNATLIAGDRSYVIRLDMNALADFEEAVGKPLTDAVADLERGSVAAIRALLLASALPRLKTKREAGAVMEAAGMEAVGAAIAKAMLSAFPQAEAGTDSAEDADPLDSPEG